MSWVGAFEALGIVSFSALVLSGDGELLGLGLALGVSEGWGEGEFCGFEAGPQAANPSPTRMTIADRIGFRWFDRRFQSRLQARRVLGMTQSD